MLSTDLSSPYKVVTRHKIREQHFDKLMRLLVTGCILITSRC